MELTTQQLRDLDRRHLWHPFTHMSLWLESEPLVIVAADGMRLIDSDGNRYLDGVSSLWCNVHGHRVPEIDDAIRRQLDRVAHSTLLGLACEPSIRLAERLVAVAPPGLSRVFYSDSGATATEIAFKIAVQHFANAGQPERTQFIGIADAYHGDTFGAMSVGRTAAFHRPYFPMLFPTHAAPSPFPYRCGFASECGCDATGSRCAARCVEALDALLRQHGPRVAAVCVEPIVQGAAGMIVHPPGYLRGVRDLCDHHGVLLIADEVAVGFGRTGRMFACEHEDVRPDLLCVAKGISGGYLPLAATLCTERVFESFLGAPASGRTFFHGHTYTGNALACAAALASLDLFERRRLVESVARKAEVLAGLLAPLRDLPRVGDVRQKGFMVGVELVADRASRRPLDPALRTGAAVCERLRRRGVILRPLGDVVVLMPPLAMDEADLRVICDALHAEIAALD